MQITGDNYTESIENMDRFWGNCPADLGKIWTSQQDIDDDGKDMKGNMKILMG